MARPLRVIYEGAVYHVTIRGNERKSIFRDDDDRNRFVLKLAECAQCYDVHLNPAFVKKVKALPVRERY